MKIKSYSVALLSRGALAVFVFLLSSMPDVFGRDIREDAVLRVTFDGNSAIDRSTGNVSAPTVENNLVYTTALPAMANSTGNAAVFDGTNSMISYDLGAAEELNITGALTYHIRVKHDAAAIALGRPEQWLMGRFSGPGGSAAVRTSQLTTSAASAGATTITVQAHLAANGAWFASPSRAGLTPGVFHDVVVRFDPGVAVTLTVYNAETGQMVGTPTVVNTTTKSLTVGMSPFEVGRRSTSPMPVNGVIEQVNVWNRALGDDEVKAISTDDGFVQLSWTLDLIKDLQPANNAMYLPGSTPIQFKVESPVGVNPDGIRLELNGVDRSADLQITGTANARDVLFSQLTANQEYVARIMVSDTEGHGKTNTIRFNTFSDGVVFIEAEDYNFQNGQFIDNPVLSSIPAPNNYLDQMSVQGVDVYTNRVPAKTDYRIGDAVGTTYCDDLPLRQNYIDAKALDAGVEDYYVGWLGDGQWMNYTRTFPANRYRVYARLANSSIATYVVQLEKVLSSAAQPNQTTFPIGRFQGGTTGGAQTYVLTPLTDVDGVPIVLNLSGVQTLRLAAVSGVASVNANYLVFIPATEEAAPFVVSAIRPGPGETDVKPTASVDVQIFSQETQVDRQSLHLTLNGQDVTGAAQVTVSAAGVTVHYQPGSMAQESVQTATLMFQDTATPPNAYSNQWQFLVARVPTGNTPEVFQDAVVRVTFDNDSPNDVSTGNISEATVANNIAYTSDLPPMANRTSRAAVFNGTDSWLSYGLGANNELKIESALTYHARIKYDPIGLAVYGREQYLMGRFRVSASETSTRVSFMTLFGTGYGGTTPYPQLTGGMSGDGAAWTGPRSAELKAGVFYDVFLRFDPAAKTVRQDVFNAETSSRVGQSMVSSVTFTNLKDALSPFDVGQRTTPANVALHGVIEQFNVWNRVLSNDEVLGIPYGPLPAVAIEIVGFQVLETGPLEIQFETNPPLRTYAIVATDNLAEPAWTEVGGVTFQTGSGNVSTAQFAAPAESPRFYRVISK